MSDSDSSDSPPAGWVVKHKFHRDGSSFKYYKSVKTGRMIIGKEELLEYVEWERTMFPPIADGENPDQVDPNLPESSNRAAARTDGMERLRQMEPKIRFCYSRQRRRTIPRHQVPSFSGVLTGSHSQSQIMNRDGAENL